MPDPTKTYSHDEDLVRTEVADVAAACVKRRILGVAFTSEDGKKWRVHVPVKYERELLKALRDAGV